MFWKELYIVYVPLFAWGGNWRSKRILFSVEYFGLTTKESWQPSFKFEVQMMVPWFSCTTSLSFAAYLNTLSVLGTSTVVLRCRRSLCLGCRSPSFNNCSHPLSQFLCSSLEQYCVLGYSVIATTKGLFCWLDQEDVPFQRVGLSEVLCKVRHHLVPCFRENQFFSHGPPLLLVFHNHSRHLMVYGCIPGVSHCMGHHFLPEPSQQLDLLLQGVCQLKRSHLHTQHLLLTILVIHSLKKPSAHSLRLHSISSCSGLLFRSPTLGS